MHVSTQILLYQLATTSGFASKSGVRIIYMYNMNFTYTDRFPE